ncbi:monocarboxylate uptake permease MctP [Streptomyces sp. NPDC047000]|uniref:monocarboxylate uptake permease MctP n=1 Tax=Streptomyces sp. NPDC047000 TaxID=3155474 RepID=UPI0033D94328
MNTDTTEAIVFTLLFATVAGLGFAAARWRRPDTMDDIDEWGLGGRRLGSWMTWFLIGGDLYTAYTFVAIPALVFNVGAAGFFSLPDLAIVYPMVYLVLVRLWSVSYAKGYVTTADFVRGRFGSRTLALLVAITGILATLPYIALQLLCIEAVLKTMGVDGQWPVVLAFVVLAGFTYRSGLRGPTVIAIVKDTLVYLVIIAAVLYIPFKLGGWGDIFDTAGKKFSGESSGGVLLASNNQLNYASLALGSALGLFLFPHTSTGALAARSRNVVKRNMAALPVYSLIVGFIALLGFMAVAAGVTPLMRDNGKPDNNTVVPLLFQQVFPHWFTGIAFAAIAVAALVPASVMSIGAANTFTRNIYMEYVRPGADKAHEARVSKVASLLVKFGALVCTLLLDPQFSTDFQLIGNVIIMQTLPAVALGLFVRWFHRGGLIAGWIAGMGSGLWMLYEIPNPATGHAHFGGSAFPLSKIGLSTGMPVYAGMLALLVNLVVAIAATVVCRAAGLPDGVDTTRPTDYLADLPEPAHGPVADTLRTPAEPVAAAVAEGPASEEQHR